MIPPPDPRHGYEETHIMKVLRIGTRGSALALWQAQFVQSQIQGAHPDLSIELVPIKTKGDKILDVPLAKVGGKGLFVKELEEALLSNDVDLAVHSMKDVPSELPTGLVLAAILEREDPRDALLSTRFTSLDTLPLGASVGTSSLRRQSQLLNLRPDLKILSLRGNVNTRIQKMESGLFDAILLAAAGVKRLQLTRYVVEYLNTQTMIPANGQGAIGLEMRHNDTLTASWVKPLNHAPTWRCVSAERAFLAKLEGGCQIPIAGYAQLKNNTLSMTGRVASLDGKTMISHTIQNSSDLPESIGQALAQNLLSRGAKQILQHVMVSNKL